MKKLSKRIFRNIFMISFLVLIASTVLTTVIVYRNFSKQNITMLENELNSLVTGVEAKGVDFFEEIDSKQRITLIDEDGTVLYDNRETASKMDNHNEREEVKEARSKGSGFSERYSDTLSEKTIYVAALLNNGMVLRMSDTSQTVFLVMMDVIVPIIVVMIITILLAFILSYRISRTITKPINELNISNPDKSQVYEEIWPLVDKINDQNNQIQKQIKELQEEHEKQDNMRRDFTANVSHELKTPLTSISGFAEIIQNGIVKDEDIKRFAGKIHDESQRLIILVGDIIKLSQLEGDDSLVKVEPVDLYESCQGVMSHLEAAANKNNIKMNLEGSHLVISGAEQIIEEIIFNLVDNAIKYNKPGGSVTVSVKKVEGRVMLSAADTGIGIPKEEQDRIFERFYRVDKSHSKEIGGTGLGLSIVKHGVLFHNAELSVESEPNVGTTISVLF